MKFFLLRDTQPIEKCEVSS